MIPADVIHAGTEAMQIYEQAIANGESQRFAEMVALRQAPRGSTDSTFFAGIGTLDKQLKRPQAIQELRKNARKMGVALTGNEFYQPSLARFPLDPRACISQSEGKDRIRRMVEKDGTGCEGAINIKAREPEKAPEPKYKIHPRIMRRLMKRELANPANATLDRRELAEKIIDKHSKKK